MLNCCESVSAVNSLWPVGWNGVDSLVGLVVPPASWRSSKDFVKWLWGRLCPRSVPCNGLVKVFNRGKGDSNDDLRSMNSEGLWSLVIAAGYNVQCCAQKLIDALELIQIMAERNLKRDECPPYTLKSAHDFTSSYQSSTTFELEKCLRVFLHFSVQLCVY